MLEAVGVTRVSATLEIEVSMVLISLAIDASTLAYRSRTIGVFGCLSAQLYLFRFSMASGSNHATHSTRLALEGKKLGKWLSAFGITKSFCEAHFFAQRIRHEPVTYIFTKAYPFCEG